MLINPDTLRSRARRRRKIHVERIQMLITPDPPRSRDGDGERRTDIESTVTAKYSMSNVFNMLITLRTHSDREHGDGEKHTTRSNVLTNAANAMTDPNKRVVQAETMAPQTQATMAINQGKFKNTAGDQLSIWKTLRSRTLKNSALQGFMIQSSNIFRLESSIIICIFLCLMFESVENHLGFEM